MTIGETKMKPKQSIREGILQRHVRSSRIYARNTGKRPRDSTQTDLVAREEDVVEPEKLGEDVVLRSG